MTKEENLKLLIAAELLLNKAQEGWNHELSVSSNRSLIEIHSNLIYLIEVIRGES
jgi:hypothetical protein